MNKFFPIGVTYGGTLPRTEWESDLREIKEAGFNCIRLEKGHRSLDDLDYILTLAGKQDLRVLVVLDHQSVPGAEDDPWLSTESFRREVETYLYKPVIERLAVHPNVFIWTIPLPDRAGDHAEAIDWQVHTIKSLDPRSRPVLKEARRVPPVVEGPVGISCNVSTVRTASSWQRERYVGYMLRKAAGDTGGAELWAMRLQAGGDWQSLDFGPEEAAQITWSAIANGAKGLIYDRWDPGPMPTRETPIKDIDGKRWMGLKRITSDSRRLLDLPGILLGTPTPPAAAVLMPRFAESSLPRLSTERSRGAYRLLADNFIATTFIDETATLDDLNRYSVIYAPLLPRCSQELADRLSEYVQGGGSLIAESPLASENTTAGEGFEIPPQQRVAPGGGLDKVFGCRLLETIEDPTPAVATTSIAQGVFTYVGANLKFFIHGPSEVLEVEQGRSSILDFLDPETLKPTAPAAVLGKFGKGKTLYIAGSLSEAYRFNEHQYARELLNGVLDWMEVPRLAEVSGLTKGFENEFEIGVIEGIDAGNRRAIICINHSDRSVHPTLTLPAGPESIVRELFTNSEEKADFSKDQLTIPTHVPEREVRVYYEGQGTSDEG